MTNKNSTLEKSNGTATFHPVHDIEVEETTEGLHIRPSADRRARADLAASLDAEEVQIRARQATDRMPVADQIRLLEIRIARIEAILGSQNALPKAADSSTS